MYILSKYHNIPGTLELFCSEETLQNVLMSGAKINVSDINIKEDKIIMENLNPIKHHLTESAWTVLNEEGEVLIQRCIFF